MMTPLDGILGVLLLLALRQPFQVHGRLHFWWLWFRSDTIYQSNFSICYCHPKFLIVIFNLLHICSEIFNNSPFHTVPIQSLHSFQGFQIHG